jgi:hypothetical protein
MKKTLDTAILIVTLIIKLLGWSDQESEDDSQLPELVRGRRYDKDTPYWERGWFGELRYCDMTFDEKVDFMLYLQYGWKKKYADYQIEYIEWKIKREIKEGIPQF